MRLRKGVKFGAPHARTCGFANPLLNVLRFAHEILVLNLILVSSASKCWSFGLQNATEPQRCFLFLVFVF